MCEDFFVHLAGFPGRLRTMVVVAVQGPPMIEVFLFFLESVYLVILVIV